MSDEFSVAGPNDKADLLNFMLDHFRVDEPISTAINLSRDDAEEFFEELIDQSLQQPVSYVLRDESGTIAACCLCAVVDRPGDEVRDVQSVKKKKNAKAEAICRLLDALESQVWRLTECDRLLCLLIVSVRSDHQRKGIARRLIDCPLLHSARKFNCQGIYTEATAFNSQQLFAANGFSPLAEIVHVDWKDETDGMPVFVCGDGRTDRAILFFMKI